MPREKCSGRSLEPTAVGRTRSKEIGEEPTFARAAVRLRSERSLRQAAQLAASFGLSAPHFGHCMGSRLAVVRSMTEEALSLRDTARGVAIRAGLLTVGGMLLGGWLLGVMMKFAGKAIHLLLLAGVALVLGGITTYEAKKHLGSSDRNQLRAVPD